MGVAGKELREMSCRTMFAEKMSCVKVEIAEKELQETSYRTMFAEKMSCGNVDIVEKELRKTSCGRTKLRRT